MVDTNKKNQEVGKEWNPDKIDDGSWMAHSTLANSSAKNLSHAQKEPEDFNDDEKEAAQAIINNANAATLTTNHKTLSDGIKANTKS